MRFTFYLRINIKNGISKETEKFTGNRLVFIKELIRIAKHFPEPGISLNMYPNCTYRNMSVHQTLISSNTIHHPSVS